MKKTLLLFALAVCSVCAVSVAFADSLTDALTVNPVAKPVEPSDYVMPLPKPESPVVKQPQEIAIPALPPSLTCKPEWILGLWELQHVYESPLGTETEAYNINPIQYLSFSKDTRFARLNAGRTQIPPQEVFRQISTHSSAVLQYILQDAGMLYLYKDSVATDTLVCFIVAETRPPYGAGNMLLMPPQGSITGRLIKVYKKVWPPKQQPARQTNVPGGRPIYMQPPQRPR